MAKKDRWFIPTNTDNIRMIIAQGLICSPNGFKKYYKDVLELVDGYVPLFKNEIGQDILAYVVGEIEGLTPALIEIDFKKISGIVKKVEDNNLIDINLNDIENEMLLFIKAPLPLTVVVSIVFKSDEDKKTFEKDAKLYSNVILNDLKLSSTIVEQKFFKENTLSGNLVSDLKRIEVINVNEVDYKQAYAYGGLLSTLFYFAKNGNKSNSIYQLFSNLDKESEKQDIDVYDYFKSFDMNSTDIKRKMDYGLIDIAINSKDFKEDIIGFLESDTWDEKIKKRTKELANKLKLFDSNVDKTVSEQFEEAKKPLDKILLMLFLREDSESLLDYNLEIFSEEDYLNFAMMFGIRDKFIKIPKELKEFCGLQNFISHKMVKFVHGSIESDIDFKPPLKPHTMMDMLNKSSLRKRLVKPLEIEHCMQTIMPNKTYSSKNGINTYIGFVEPRHELLEDAYFKTISKKKISKQEYNKFSKMK